jgi:hypothetical protein
MGWAALLLCIDEAVSYIAKLLAAVVLQARFKAAALCPGGVHVDQTGRA